MSHVNRFAIALFLLLFAVRVMILCLVNATSWCKKLRETRIIEPDYGHAPEVMVSILNRKLVAVGAVPGTLLKPVAESLNVFDVTVAFGAHP